jgi:hypothetical protein
MKKLAKTIRKSLAVFMLLAFAVGSFNLPLAGGANIAHAATVTPANWNLSGNYVIAMNYNGTDYSHDLTLSQDSSGNLTGNGGSPAGANVYTYTITSGSVSGDNFNLTANYTATSDAVTPQTVLTMNGTVASNGTISGTWSDNYQGGSRSGTFSTTSGAAVAIPVPSTVKVTIRDYIGGTAATATSANNSDFLMSATWDAANLGGAGTGQYSLTSSGYNGNPTPYQAITADMSSGASYSTNAVTNSVVGASCTAGTPFALLGYTSGNTLAEAQAATISSTVPSFTNMTSDKFVIVWTQDCSVSVTTNAATAITGTNATLNGMNGSTAATGHSFWVSTSPFVTTSPTLPANVYSTPDLGPIAANTAFSAQLSSVSGLPTITPSTTYYVAAWVNVNGTWMPGQVLSFTTAASGTIGGTVGGVGVLKVDSIETLKDVATADGTFTNGWRYAFNITVPSNETHLALKFSNWTMNGGTSTINTANNIRISSVQADNSGATILLTGADTYSSPNLNITGDLNPTMDGKQVRVVVEVAVPVGTANGSYTTTYGIRTQ